MKSLTEMLAGLRSQGAEDAYSKLQADDDNAEGDEKPPSPHRLVEITPVTLALVIASSILLGILASMLALTLVGSRQDSVQVKPCGSSAEQAVSKGCRFDIMSFSWLPDACYDDELTRAFSSARQLEWFVDENRTQPLTHEQVMTGKYSDVYVDREYHVRHCMAMWKKLHRAVLAGGRIDGYIGSYEHTEHCEVVMLRGHAVAFDALDTRILVKYPDCGI